MKVLQITTNYPNPLNPIFGVFMKEQVESLEPFGVENTIFFSNGAKRKHGVIEHIKSIFKLQYHLLTHKYDLIHCHSVISGLILLLSSGAFFNKCVVSFQCDPQSGSDGRFFRKLYPWFNKLIVKLPGEYTNLEKVVYLPNGCNENVFKPMDKDECKRKLGLDLSKRYILFVDSNVGKKRTQKRRDRFDATLDILRNKYGYDNLETLVLIGVKRENVPTYMNACELHLLVSDFEGSPNSVKECVMCNVPIVSTNVGNVQDMLSGVRNVYVSESSEPEALADKVDKVLSYNAEVSCREDLINKGYSMAKVAEKLYKIYKEL